MFLIAEGIGQEGYMRLQANPWYIGTAVASGDGPRFRIDPDLPTNGNFTAIDFTVMDFDQTTSIIGKNKLVSFGVGYRFLWRSEGMRLDHYDNQYLGITRSWPEGTGDLSYGAGRFVAKTRIGIGPSLDLRVFPDSDKFGARLAVGAGWYGSKKGTYNTIQASGFYKVTDQIAVKVGYEKMNKLFSHSLDGIPEEMESRLGEQLKVTTKEISFGVILMGEFNFLRWVTGGFEN